MIGIVFATQMEAAPFLSRLTAAGAACTPESELTRFQFGSASGTVAVVGMGVSASKAGTERFIDRVHPSQVINAGIAGALSDALTLGAVYRVSEAVTAGDASSSVRFAPGRFQSLPAARLVTSAVPVFSETVRVALRPLGEMVDMEGAIVGQVCASRGIRCVGLKCISDFAGDGDRETLRANLNRASTVLAARLIRGFAGDSGRPVVAEPDGSGPPRRTRG